MTNKEDGIIGNRDDEIMRNNEHLSRQKLRLFLEESLPAQEQAFLRQRYRSYAKFRKTVEKLFAEEEVARLGQEIFCQLQKNLPHANLNGHFAKLTSDEERTFGPDDQQIVSMWKKIKQTIDH